MIYFHCPKAVPQYLQIAAAGDCLKSDNILSFNTQILEIVYTESLCHSLISVKCEDNFLFYDFVNLCYAYNLFDYILQRKLLAQICLSLY